MSASETLARGLAGLWSSIGEGPFAEVDRKRRTEREDMRKLQAGTDETYTRLR